MSHTNFSHIGPSGPAGVPRTLSLRTGQRLIVRYVEPIDADALRGFYEQLDAEATYRRFFSALPPPPDYFDRLASIAERNGRALVVADVATGVIVAEADYELLANGNGEMAMTVSHPWRGWMGPFLLALLCQVAEALGVPNFESEILSTNRPMRAVTRERGEALLPLSDWRTVRVAFATRGPAPAFAPGVLPKVLVETRSSAFAAVSELAAGGYDVMTCHGRNRSGDCPLDCSAACPLVASADLVILAGPDDPDRDRLLEAHRRFHPTAPVSPLPRNPGTPITGLNPRNAADQHLGSADPR